MSQTLYQELQERFLHLKILHSKRESFIDFKRELEFFFISLDTTYSNALLDELTVKENLTTTLSILTALSKWNAKYTIRIAERFYKAVWGREGLCYCQHEEMLCCALNCYWQVCKWLDIPPMYLKLCAVKNFTQLTEWQYVDFMQIVPYGLNNDKALHGQFYFYDHTSNKRNYPFFPFQSTTENELYEELVFLVNSWAIKEEAKKQIIFLMLCFNQVAVAGDTEGVWSDLLEQQVTEMRKENTQNTQLLTIYDNTRRINQSQDNWGRYRAYCSVSKNKETEEIAVVPIPLIATS